MDRYGDPQLTVYIRRAGMSSANHHDLSAHFRNMDLAQVDMQVLSISSQLPYYASEGQAVELARLANDIYAGILREFPKRFAAFACTRSRTSRPLWTNCTARSTSWAWWESRRVQL